MQTSLLIIMVAASVALNARAADRGSQRSVPVDGYTVLVAPGETGEFRAAAEALAAFHEGRLHEFDPADLGAALEVIRSDHARFVVFVLPPGAIDVMLCHAILEMATRVDPDEFTDFEYGFITGRDGAAALRFVERIKAAWPRRFGNRAGFYGSWEGMMLPLEKPTAMAPLGLDADWRLVHTRAKQDEQRRQARDGLAALSGRDVVMMFSHGYPDQMAACVRAPDLREWKVDLAPAVLFNCSCYNGAPGKWFDFGPGGKLIGRPAPGADESVALALLDSGISAYLAGVDPWHGPLTMQVFQHAVDDGLRLGEAAKRMHDRLTLEFLPERIHYQPPEQRAMTGEGTQHRRTQGAAMILYGDPALAPFADTAKKLLSVRAEELQPAEKGKPARLRITIEARPMVEGGSGLDFMLPQARWMDYYSVKTQDVMHELSMEAYRVLDLPPEWRAVGALKVVDAKCGDQEVPTREVQSAIEKTHDGRRLHVRVPIAAPMFGNMWLQNLTMKGATIVLEADLDRAGPGGY